MDTRMVSVKRIFNLGSYENVSVEIQAAVEPGESTKDVLDKLAAESENWHRERYSATKK